MARGPGDPIVSSIQSSLMRDIGFPIPVNPVIAAAEANYASKFYEKLVRAINSFDASLDSEFEVGVRLVSFGQSIVFHLEGMGFFNPSLITFAGHTQDGEPVELIQHVSQISILLMKLPREDPSQPKRPIGFLVDDPESGADE